MVKSVDIWVKGKVQGVFFRKATKMKADELQLNGWVKNLDSGEVQVHAEGDPDALEKLLTWCHSGPQHAVVTDVLVKESLLSNVDGFTIIR